MNNNNQTNNAAMDDNKDKSETLTPAVAHDDYQKTLGELNHGDIVDQLKKNGISEKEAEELASEYDEDR